MTSRLNAGVLVIGLALVPLASSIPARAADAPKRLEKPTEIITDAAITSRIKADFARDKTVGALNISVDTRNAVVTLSGSAKSRDEAEKAAAIARNAPGVMSVKNEIRVGGGR